MSSRATPRAATIPPPAGLVTPGGDAVASIAAAGGPLTSLSISRATITVVRGNNNNIALPEAPYITVTPISGGGEGVVTGMAGGLVSAGIGRLLLLENINNGGLTLSPLNAASSPANQFEFETTEPQFLRPFEIAMLVYNAGRAKWHNVSIPILSRPTRGEGWEPGEPAVRGIAGTPGAASFTLEGNGVRTEWELGSLGLGKTAGFLPSFPPCSVVKEAAGGAGESTTLPAVNCTVLYPLVTAGAEQTATLKFSVAPPEGHWLSFTFG